MRCGSEAQCIAQSKPNFDQGCGTPGQQPWGGGSFWVFFWFWYFLSFKLGGYFFNALNKQPAVSQSVGQPSVRSVNLSLRHPASQQAVSQSVNRSLRHGASQQSDSQSASQPASQSVSQPVTPPRSQSVSQSVSQRVTPPLGRPASTQSANQPASEALRSVQLSCASQYEDRA